MRFHTWDPIVPGPWPVNQGPSVAWGGGNPGVGGGAPERKPDAHGQSQGTCVPGVPTERPVRVKVIWGQSL